jgi:hypothetical protein
MTLSRDLMKSTIMSLLALAFAIVGSRVSASAATPTDLLTLQEGESWTYEFRNLPLVSIQSSPGASNSRFTLSLTNGLPETALRWEAFETGTGNLTASGVIIGPGGATVSNPTPWSDLQGVMRFTALTGTVVIARFEIEVQLYQLHGIMHYHRHGFAPLEVPLPNIATQFVSSF